MDEGKPDTLVTSIRLPKKLHDEISVLAKDGHRSINQQMILTIEKGLEVLHQEQARSSDLRNVGHFSRLT